eukprot:4886076-Amphidinium_carterae.1
MSGWFFQESIQPPPYKGFYWVPASACMEVPLRCCCGSDEQSMTTCCWHCCHPRCLCPPPCPAVRNHNHSACSSYTQ